jgi:predicted regulator of Ras-like GTPase activity (Roadblock/LC7/MglB family)
MSKLDQLLREIQTELGPGFVATSIVGMDGLIIANHSLSPNFDANKVAARMAMVMSLAAKSGSKMGMGEVDHNLITTDQAYIISRFIGDGSYYWIIAIARDSVLGMVYMIMEDFADRLWEAIPR